MDIDSLKKVAVVGWGDSGIALCNLLLFFNKKVYLTEIREAKCFNSVIIKRYKEQGVKFEFGANTKEFIQDVDLIVLSPGVDPQVSPIVKIANNLGIPYVGEVEFAACLTKAKFVAITGTNGKTTTTFLTYKLLKEKFKNVFLGGNIGIPLSSFILDTKPKDLIVLEISSFQLETIMNFKPYVAALLNLEPDHLDRYPNLNDYYNAKMNIFKNQTQDDWAVIYKDIFDNFDIEKKVKSKIIKFSDEFTNANFSCIYKIGSVFGLDKDYCSQVFSSFKGLPHRLQVVSQKNGITFINDSKATNPASTVWALKNIDKDIILLAGGKDKGLDYAQIIPYLKRVKKINLYGAAANKIDGVLKSSVTTEIFSGFNEAITDAFKSAKSLDVVLLSPMCSSYDMFSNYKERGRKFIEIVKSL